MSETLKISAAIVNRAIEQIILIDDHNSLNTHIEPLLACTSVGLDTEFVRERTFYPKPGLLQFSDGRQIWLIDPVALADDPTFQSFLSDLLNNPTSCKILHSVGEDFEVLEMLCGQRPQPLFDTQIAAAMLGWPLQLRYESLVEELLGLQFPGGLARNNWCSRPLPDAWLQYAAQDVIALPAMRVALEQRLEQAGRLHWLHEDCHRMVKSSSQATAPILRIRSAARLNDDALARLDLLANWRDDQARARDLPRSFILNDATLLELARKPPQDASALAKVDGVHAGLVRRHAEEMLALLGQPTTHFQRPPELVPLTSSQQVAIKQMQQIVRNIAEQLNLEPPLIASRRELTRLVQTGNSEWLNGWRGEVLADSLDQWIKH